MAVETAQQTMKASQLTALQQLNDIAELRYSSDDRQESGSGIGEAPCLVLYTFS
jgi:hypothetical protein